MLNMAINKNFWDNLEKPFFALAPMADVTDIAFRTMFAKYGAPDVFWTEFVSCDGLMSSKGRENLKVDLLFEKDQRPIVAQLFTSKPENMYEAGMFVKKLGFDGIDINMDCSDKKIEKQGSGASLIQNKDLAVEIIESAKRTGLPVSVKTRIGYNKNEIEEWIPKLLNTKISALTIHLRTRKEMSKVPANWELLKEIVEMRNKISPNTLIIGNGDVESIKDGLEKIKNTDCDGVMIGRGIFGNPWFFNKKIDKENLDVREILNALVEHSYLFEKYLSVKSFSIMKKHFKAYVKDFNLSKELRMKLMDEAKNAKDVEYIINEFLKENY